jgi:allophycocyanin beta subunit
MTDNAITAVITSFDLQGKYVDGGALQKLQQDFQLDELKVQTAALIRDHAATIVKKAVSRSLNPTESSSFGGMHTSRRYAACIRDLDFYLRYSTYAMLAGDAAILDERVLNGLKETYLALGVPLEATVQSIQAMKLVVTELVGSAASDQIGCYFNYLCAALS